MWMVSELLIVDQSLGFLLLVAFVESLLLWFTDAMLIFLFQCTVFFFIIAADTLAGMDQFETDYFGDINNQSVDQPSERDQFDANLQLAYAIERIGPLVLAMKKKFDDYCEPGCVSLSEQTAIGAWRVKLMFCIKYKLSLSHTHIYYIQIHTPTELNMLSFYLITISICVQYSTMPCYAMLCNAVHVA